ncbi:hypothetical protein [Kribbella sp. NPDC048928]
MINSPEEQARYDRGAEVLAGIDESSSPSASWPRSAAANLSSRCT